MLARDGDGDLMVILGLVPGRAADLVVIVVHAEDHRLEEQWWTSTKTVIDTEKHRRDQNRTDLRLGDMALCCLEPARPLDEIIARHRTFPVEDVSAAHR